MQDPKKKRIADAIDKMVAQGADDEEIDIVVRSIQNEPDAPPPRKRIGIKGIVAPLASGLTLGASDEILGGIEGLASLRRPGGFSAGYQRGKEKVRAAGADFREEHPTLSPAVELAAGIAAPGFGIAKAIGKGASLAPKAFLGSTAGGALGAASGAATAPEGERMAGAKMGSIFGSGAGAVIPAIGSAAGGAANLLGAGSPARTRSVGLRKAVEAMSDADPSQGAEAVRLGVPTRAFDIGGEKALRATRAAEALSPETGIRKGLNERQAGQADRLFGQTEAALGVKGRDIYELTQEVMKRAQEKAGPLYDTARSHGPLQSEKLAEVLGRPTMQKALAAGRRKAMDEGEALGDPVDVRVIDYAKRALDDKISAAVKAGERDDVRVLGKLKRELLAIVDEEVPEYAEARKTWGGEMSYNKAVTMGSRIFGASKKPDASIAKRLAAMSEAEREGFKLGVLGAVRDVLRSNSDNVDKVRKLIGTPKAREALSEVIGTVDGNSAFAKAMRMEGERFGAGAFIKNHSQTANLLSDMSNLTDIAVSMLADGATGNVAGIASKGVRAFLGNRSKVGGGKIARATGTFLNASVGSPEYDELMQALAQASVGRGTRRLKP